MSARLQSTERQLQMGMKKHSMEERLYQRPTPAELKEMLPAVYQSLSEEAKEGVTVRQSTPLFKVCASLVMATAEQLMLVEKVGMEINHSDRDPYHLDFA